MNCIFQHPEQCRQFQLSQLIEVNQVKQWHFETFMCSQTNEYTKTLRECSTAIITF